MRALRDPDAFLATDLGVRHALVALGRPGDPRSALAVAEPWRPYRAYAMLHLWAQSANRQRLRHRSLPPAAPAPPRLTTPRRTRTSPPSTVCAVVRMDRARGSRNMLIAV